MLCNLARRLSCSRPRLQSSIQHQLNSSQSMCISTYIHTTTHRNNTDGHIQLNSNKINGTSDIQQLTSIHAYDADTFFSQATWSLNQLFTAVDNTEVDISDAEIERLYELSMLHVPGDNTVKHSIKSMIQWMSSIQHVNTDTVQPIYTPLQIIEQSASNDNTLHASNTQRNERYRADVVTDGNYQHRILQNAPNSDKGFVVVPKVVDLT